MNEIYISVDIETDGPILGLSPPPFCRAASIFQHRRKYNDNISQRGLSGRVAILILGFLCSSSQSSRDAIAQDASSTNAPPRSERLLTCPPKSPQGATFIEMGIVFSVERPTQDVTCLYSDGYRIEFAVEKGCDIEPTGIIADAIGPRGSGFTQGRHQCLESEAGAGKCHVVCRH
jgi:hypothetical protein